MGVIKHIDIEEIKRMRISEPAFEWHKYFGTGTGLEFVTYRRRNFI